MSGTNEILARNTASSLKEPVRTAVTARPLCLHLSHVLRRSVRTASPEQVRKPIFRDGLRQWRNYEPWLGPLKDALGDASTRYRD
jgi:hypothetical protein